MQNDKAKFKKEFISRLIKFTVKTIELCDTIKEEKLLVSIINQVIRSASSIGANVVEARAASSKKDYIKFFEIALKSTNETIYWFMVIEKVSKTIKHDDLRELKLEVIEIAKVLGSSILTLKGK